MNLPNSPPPDFNRSPTPLREGCEALSLVERLGEIDEQVPSDPKAALAHVEALHEEAVARQETRAIAISTCLMAVCRSLLNDPAESLCMAERAFSLAEAVDEPRWQARALNVVGVSRNALGNYEAALTSFWNALPLCRTSGDSCLESKLIGNVGVSYTKLGRYDDAFEQFHRAQKIQEANEDWANAAFTLHQLGVLQQERGRWRESLRYFERSRELFVQIGGRKGLTHVLNNLGLTLSYLGRHGEAACHFEMALRECRALGMNEEEANVLGNMAKSLSAQGQWCAALNNYEQCRLVFERINKVEGLAEVLVDVGVLCARVEAVEVYNPARAVSSLEAAVALTEKHGQRHLACQAHEHLARQYKSQRRFEQALRHHERFHELRQLLFGEESDRRLQRLQVHYEVEQTKKDAEIARTRNVELAAALAEASRLRQIAEQAAHRDSLTGLYNRRYLNDWLERCFRRETDGPASLVVLLLDLDHFKRVNDGFSHRIGDIVLQTIANILRINSGEADVAARYGGEEFVIVMPNHDTRSAMERCETIRLQVEQFHWQSVAPGLAVTTSGGICESHDYAHFERMLDDADAKLYKAKIAGRNRIVA